MEPISVIIWISVIVFALTALITLLDLSKLIQIDNDKSKILFKILIIEIVIIEIVIIAVGAFGLYIKNYFNISHKNNKDIIQNKQVNHNIIKKSNLSITIEKDRFLPKSIIIKEEDKTEESRISDLIILKKNNKILKSYEFYHTAKSKKFLNYPFMAMLFQNLFPTEVEYKITDFNKNGKDEILL